MKNKKYVNIAIVALVYLAFAAVLWPFKQAIIFALLFAFALNPLLVKLKSQTKIRLSNFGAISILVTSLVVILLLPLSIVIIRLAKMAGRLEAEKLTELPIVQKFHDVADVFLGYINSFAQNFGLDLSSQIDFKSMAAQVGKEVLSVGSGILTDVPSALFQFFVFILMLYYILLNQTRLKQGLENSKLLTASQLQSLVVLFEGVCYLALVSTLVCAFLQAVVVAVASLAVGLDGSGIIFIAAFFMAFIPVVGSSPLTISLIIYSALIGNYGSAVVLAIAAGFAGTIDNVIKTYLFSSKEDSVSPIISLLTIIGSLAAFGILGIFLGPIIAELAVKIGKIIYEE